MKVAPRYHDFVSPWLLPLSALAIVTPARAQSEAVTQFAPLDDSPIPTAPSAAEPHTSPGVQTAPVTSQNEPMSPSATVNDTSAASPRTSPSKPLDATPSTSNTTQPTVGSSWLGAPAAAAAPATVVDSGLPVFVEPAKPPMLDDPKQPPAAALKAEETEETHRVAATFSLARALLLSAVVPSDVKNAVLYEGTIELKVFERLSLAVLGGVGGFDVPLSQVEQNVHVKGKELGGQARIYVLGDFDHGLSVGAEYMRVWAEADPIEVDAIPPPPLPAGTGRLTGDATLTGLGAFVGYKISAWFGLTCDAKLGIQKLTADGKGTVTGDIGPGYPTLTESETFHFDQLVPLINVNVGWAI
jgi:hypothetical protein